MEGLEALLEKQVQQIQQIETFFDLQACKSHIVADVNALNLQRTDAAGVLQKAKSSLQHFRENLGPKYVDVIRKTHRNNQLIIHLLERLSNNEGGTARVLREQHGNVPGSSVRADGGNAGAGSSVQQIKLGGKLLTVEKMFLSEYQKSPFVEKFKPRCLSFLDFHINISQEEFEQIPKYMRGREILDELVAFLQTTIVPCFEEKYTLLYKNKKAVTNQQDLALWKTFNQQQSAFPNNKFITQGDIARKMGRMIDKKINVKLQMLRHLHILQETRNEGTVYYIWIRE